MKVSKVRLFRGAARRKNGVKTYGKACISDRTGQLWHRRGAGCSRLWRRGTNTLGAIAGHPNFNCPNLKKLGLFNIDGVTAGEKTDAPAGAFARLQEQSMGKDTTIGHWEIAGVVSPNPLPTFPNGFPEELIQEFEPKPDTKSSAICLIPAPRC